MGALTRRPGASLHHQLYSILHSGIYSGRYGDGALLPSEDALAESYRVSRATVRRAMQTLEAKSLVERLPGIGTRVTMPGGVPAVVAPAFDLVGAFPEPGELNLIGFEYVGAAAEVAEFLELTPGDPVLRVSRLRQVKGTPFRLTRHYLPEAVGKRVTADMLEMRLLADVLVDLGYRLRRTRNLISAVLAEVGDADLLDIEPGAALLEMSRVVRDENDRPILLQHSITPPEREKLCIESDEYFGGK